ncbi:MAG: pectate lyase, partial [Planctomycetota bacterium]
KRWAYRIDPPGKKRRNYSTLDDDISQSATRFLMRLDHALEQGDKEITEMAAYAINALVDSAQYPCGGFPQVWEGERPESWHACPDAAGYPETWSRVYEGHKKYWYRYTLNDDVAESTLKTLLLAHRIYQKARYREAGLRLADFLLRAQMPQHQPAWAQQYNFDLQPIWARKFEPPAIASSESQSTIEALIMMTHETGDHRYAQAAKKALDYLRSCERVDGRFARFYELRTNRPLFMNKRYELTYDSSGTPSHYGFLINDRTESLRQKLVGTRAEMSRRLVDRWIGWRPSPTSRQSVLRALAIMDDRGAFVEEGSMKFHRHEGRIISMRTTSRALQEFAAALGSPDR